MVGDGRPATRMRVRQRARRGARRARPAREARQSGQVRDDEAFGPGDRMCVVSRERCSAGNSGQEWYDPSKGTRRVQARHSTEAAAVPAADDTLSRCAIGDADARRRSAGCPRQCKRGAARSAVHLSPASRCQWETKGTMGASRRTPRRPPHRQRLPCDACMRYVSAAHQMRTCGRTRRSARAHRLCRDRIDPVMRSAHFLTRSVACWFRPSSPAKAKR